MRAPRSKQAFQPTRRQWLAAGLGLCFSFTRRPALGQFTGAANAKLAAYDELMTRFMREHKPPGAALAVTFQGRLVYHAASGMPISKNVNPSNRLRCSGLPASANRSPPRR